jgi:hypothetical protein
MESDDFVELYLNRWTQVKSVFGTIPFPKMSFGEYPHFDTPRGFAVTFFEPKIQRCNVLFAEKILNESKPKIDAIIRHEFGHVVDFLLSPGEVDLIAGRAGYLLPRTDERRADTIAYVIWRQIIFYDKETLVQTLDAHHAYSIRPVHLGL